MNYKIVSDSSANLLSLDGVNFATVPLHIISADRSFVDDSNLNLHEMQDYLASYKGKTSTSCPNAQQWIDAFDDSDVVFCVTITSQLSGSFASAKIAASMYESDNPGRKVYVIDSLSTGPEMVLIINKISDFINSGLDAESIYKEICDYQHNTHLYFSLSSLDNLAKNGRISPILAKGIGMLGIRIIGKASKEGTLQPVDKSRGDKRAYSCLISHMKKLKYMAGKIIISHTDNLTGANELKELIKQELNYFDTIIMEDRGLCSFYAEPGSILVAFEA